MQPLLIIGTGLAGYTLAREWRRHVGNQPLSMLSLDDGAFYSKPMLSNAFAKGKDAAALVQQGAEQMAATLSATVHTDCRVEGIDTAARRLQLAEGELTYGQLVLAMGAAPLQLPIAGDGAADILSVNTLRDYTTFRAALTGRRRVAIMGPGLIGCEFANDLLTGGLEVCVIGPDHHPMSHLMPAPAGRALQSALAALGVDWRLQTTVSRVDRRGDGYRLTLSDERQIDADVVLSAVGLRPQTQLAAAAGIAVERGIVVDRLLQTSAAAVHALGDCAQIDGLVLPYVMPITLAARALAATLAGTPTPLTLPAMPVAVKTPAHPVVVSPTAPGAAGEWHCEAQADGGQVARFVGDDGALLGFALTGSQALKQKAALQQQLPAVLA